MKIEQTNEEIIVRLSKNFNVNEIKRFFDFVKYRELSNDSKSTDKFVEDISNEINSNMWQEYIKRNNLNEFSR